MGLRWRVGDATSFIRGGDGWPVPHGRWWEHFPGRTQPPGGWLRPGASTAAAVIFWPSIFPLSTCFQNLPSLIRILRLHISLAFRQMGVHPFSRHLSHFNFATGGEHLHNVTLGCIPGEPPTADFGGFRGRALPFPSLSIPFGWFGFGTRMPPVVLSALRRTRRA